LAPVLSESGTRLWTAEDRAGGRIIFERTSQFSLESRCPKFYACSPPMISGTAFRSLAGVAQIWFPALVEHSLRMGEVGMLVDESELREELQTLQNTVYGILVTTRRCWRDFCRPIRSATRTT
jgi:hypothetical protein